VAASVIVSPNPTLRLTSSLLFRVAEPGLGPSPPWLARIGLQYTFASGLFRRGEDR